MKKEVVELLVIPEGTLIKVHGIPFTLLEDAKVYGLRSNLELALCEEIKVSYGEPKEIHKDNLSL